MTQDPIADTRSRLDDLEERIRAARNSLGARGEISDDAEKEWKRMIEMHGDIRRKLDAGANHSAGVVEGIRFDVDILRSSFEKWVAKVENRFSE